jgi:DHA1 family tetracycline resistance protein-like MFS transporter
MKLDMTPTTVSAHNDHRPAVAFLIAAVLLSALATGIVIPVLPPLVKQLARGSTAEAATWIGRFGALFAVMQFFGQPLLGGLSDRYGRRPILLISMFGLAFDYAVMALAPTIGWLVVGRAVSGLAASTSAAANAYIVDVTAPDRRAARFGYLMAATGAGLILGPGIGGLLGQIGPRLPFWGAAALCLVNGVFGLLVLPESLARGRRTPFSLRIANPLGALRLFAETAGLARLAAVFFLYGLAFQASETIWVLYSGYRYHWGPALNGLSLVLFGLGSVLVSLIVVRPTIAWLGERGAMLAGLAFGVCSLLIAGFAPSGWLFMAAIPVGWLFNLFGPGVQGLMTARVASSEQGRLQGANGSLASLTTMIGPLFFAWVFAHSISDWSAFAPPGLAFYASAAVMTAAFALALGVRRWQSRPPPHEEEPETLS